MPIATGTFALSTTAAPTTQDVTISPAFKPDWVLFLWTLQTTDGLSNTHSNYAIGFTTATEQVCFNVAPADNTDDRSGRAQSPNDCIIICQANDTGGDGTILGSAQLNSFLSDGFRLDIDDDFAAAYDVFYMAGAGLGIPNIVNFAEPGSTGTQSITTTHKPAGGIILSAGFTSSAESTSPGSGQLMVGAWDASGAEGCTHMVNVGGVSQSVNCNRYGYSNELIGRVEAGIPGNEAVEARAEFSQVESDGVEINWLEVSGNTVNYWMISWPSTTKFDLSTWLTRTDGTNIATTGVGFLPQGVFMFSHCVAESTQDTSQTQAKHSMGVGTSSTSRFGIGHQSRDAAGANSQVGTGVASDEIYQRVGDIPSGYDGEGDLVSLDTDGYTTVMDDPDPNAALVFTVSLAAGGGGTKGYVLA